MPERDRNDAEFQRLLREYEAELKRMARRARGDVRGMHSLYTTDLALDACDALATKAFALGWSKDEFLRAAARHMSNRLIDGKRKRKERLATRDIDLLLLAGPLDEEGEARLGIEELRSALDRLRVSDSRAADVIELRYFANATINEIGNCLGIGETTVKTDQRLAIAYLRAELGAEVSNA